MPEEDGSAHKAGHMHLWGMYFQTVLRRYFGRDGDISAKVVAVLRANSSESTKTPATEAAPKLRVCKRLYWGSSVLCRNQVVMFS